MTDRDADDHVEAGEISGPLSAARRWLKEGRKVAMATVTDTWGSSPRQMGSILVASDSMDFAGSVSGGCVEGAVIEAAQETLHTGQPRNLEFGVSHNDAWSVGLACGGTVSIYLESLDLETVDSILAALATRRPMVRIVPLDGGEVIHYCPGAHSGQASGTELTGIARRAIDQGKSQTIALGSQRTFLHVFTPKRRLFIFGAVHIAQHLSTMAHLAGYDVTVIDPREAFASISRFPAIHLVTTWPDEAMRALNPDPYTAVVTLTHDPKLDDPALEAALASSCIYVGALGSRKTHAARMDRLRQRGVANDALNRIHAPVGLNLGGRSAPEIAISILAEVTQVFNRGSSEQGRPEIPDLPARSVAIGEEQ